MIGMTSVLKLDFFWLEMTSALKLDFFWLETTKTDFLVMGLRLHNIYRQGVYRSEICYNQDNPTLPVILVNSQVLHVFMEIWKLNSFSHIM